MLLTSDGKEEYSSEFKSYYNVKEAEKLLIFWKKYYQGGQLQSGVNLSLMLSE